MLAIRLPASIEKRLEKLAKRTGRTKTYYAREAILRHLEDLEDVHAADAVLERIQRGEMKTIPLDEVIANLGFQTEELEDKPVRRRRAATRRSR